MSSTSNSADFASFLCNAEAGLDARCVATKAHICQLKKVLYKSNNTLCDHQASQRVLKELKSQTVHHVNLCEVRVVQPNYNHVSCHVDFTSAMAEYNDLLAEMPCLKRQTRHVDNKFGDAHVIQLACSDDKNYWVAVVSVRFDTTTTQTSINTFLHNAAAGLHARRVATGAHVRQLENVIYKLQDLLYYHQDSHKVLDDLKSQPFCADLYELRSETPTGNGVSYHVDFTSAVFQYNDMLAAMPHLKRQTRHVDHKFGDAHVIQLACNDERDHWVAIVVARFDTTSTSTTSTTSTTSSTPTTSTTSTTSTTPTTPTKPNHIETKAPTRPVDVVDVVNATTTPLWADPAFGLAIKVAHMLVTKPSLTVFLGGSLHELDLATRLDQLADWADGLEALGHKISSKWWEQDQSPDLAVLAAQIESSDLYVITEAALINQLGSPDYVPVARGLTSFVPVLRGSTLPVVLSDNYDPHNPHNVTVDKFLWAMRTARMMSDRRYLAKLSVNNDESSQCYVSSPIHV